MYSHAHKTIIGHAIAKTHITSGQYVKTRMLTVNIMTISLFKYKIAHYNSESKQFSFPLVLYMGTFV